MNDYGGRYILDKESADVDGKENWGSITLNLNLFTNLAQYFFYFHVYLV